MPFCVANIGIFVACRRGKGSAAGRADEPAADIVGVAVRIAEQ